MFFWLFGTAFPRCGGVRVRLWLQPGRKEVRGATALGSFVAPAAWLCRAGGVHCVLFPVCEPGTAQVPEGTSLVWRGQAGSSCMVVFPFTTLFHHAPQHLCSCLSTSCDHFSVGTRVTFFTNCCNVRLLNNLVGDGNPGCSQKWWEMCFLQTAVPPGEGQQSSSSSN